MSSIRSVRPSWLSLDERPVPALMVIGVAPMPVPLGTPVPPAGSVCETLLTVSILQPANAAVGTMRATTTAARRIVNNLLRICVLCSLKLEVNFFLRWTARTRTKCHSATRLPPELYDLYRNYIEATAELVSAATVRLGKTAEFLSS